MVLGDKFIAQGIMKDIGKITKKRGSVLRKLTIKHMRVNGNKTAWMDTENLSILLEIYIQEYFNITI